MCQAVLDVWVISVIKTDIKLQPLWSFHSKKEMDNKHNKLCGVLENTECCKEKKIRKG